MIEDPVNRGRCQQDAVTQVQLRRAVYLNDGTYMLHSAFENFVGGKFRDLLMTKISKLAPRENNPLYGT